MIIDETFMWLYVTAKIGNALCVLGIATAIVGAISAIVMGFNVGDREWKDALITVKRVFFTMLVTSFISLSAYALTPSRDDVKAYAAYAIGKDVATSAEAKRLFDAAINYIEGKATEK